MKHQLRRLSELVRVNEVAPRNLRTEVSAYLARCKAKGYNVALLTKNLKKCGAKLVFEAPEDQMVPVGSLVWAKIKSHPWWPVRFFLSTSSARFSFADNPVPSFVRSSTFPRGRCTTRQTR